MPSSISNSNRLPWAALAAVVLTLLFQGGAPHAQGLWRLLLAYSSPLDDDGLRLEAQVRLAEGTHGKRLILLTGASVTREGFDAPGMNAALAGTDYQVINFGISGGQPVDLYMLSSRLAALKPALVIHMMYVRDFFKKDYSFAKLPLYYNGHGLRAFCKAIGFQDVWNNKLYMRDALLGRLWPLYRFRDSIHHILLRQAPTALLDPRGTADFRSFHMDASEQPLAPRVLERQIRQAKQDAYARTPYTAVQKVFFDQYLQGWTDRHTPVIVLDAPYHPRFQEMYRPELDSEYRATVLAETTRASIRYVPREALPPFVAEDFFDFVHLIAPGRQKLSAFTVDLIRRQMGITTAPSGPAGAHDRGGATGP